MSKKNSQSPVQPILTSTPPAKKKPLTYKQALRRKAQLEKQLEKLSARMVKLFSGKPTSVVPV